MPMADFYSTVPVPGETPVDYCRLVSSGSLLPECEQFLDLMANSSRWRGEEVPDRIGTVKLQQSVTLIARQEHLVWGKLPNNVPMSPGSTVIVKPTSSRSLPRNIMIGRVITPLWGDSHESNKHVRQTHNIEEKQ